MSSQRTIFLKSVIPFITLLLVITLGSLAQSTTHTVKEGETLFSIAQQYGIEVQQLKKWNADITANELSVGQSLIIRAGNPNNEDKTVHTVEKQETLFSISKMYNVSIAEIKRWNELSSNNLSVGQKLVIYPSKESDKKRSIVVEEDTQQNTYYTVKSGDSLYRIAQSHNMSVAELKELNDLSSNTIRIGQKLTVRSQGGEAPPSVASKANSSPQGKFISYKVTEGTKSVDELLNKFRMSETEFRALNNGIKGSTLRPGQTVTVLAPPTKSYNNPYLNDANKKSLGSTSVSKYGKNEKASPTTNGELYNPQALTAAHSNIALGSVIFIENPENKKGIYVRINDRNSGSSLKLSATAWQLLGFTSSEPTVMIYQN
ncbi:LysM peptidoglycan-binding domain-containing protein [Fodinibius halophilus]|uniref:LysM peptidoglycan-binding domain-containing protein n=1 Tax=Fodinibius halophilus TaxID=1736908 RepID=A0A6M1T3I8_9BACT|nr:LysM peptidoglycan-binding domain-containing protein [Fodinibius halophilus]NGP88639.1 LysM peptidoglycan-binding domain-containing protein [Fodinibius halophilus]